jgi:crotonobetainyl-CoA:carnitine CoA-transferase CaiB-like acyl-CoA transferase
MNEIFKDLIVIELAGILAGPSVGMFFSELGAKVIKIENPKTGGDPTRKWKTVGEDKNSLHSTYYASVNYNKEVLFLNLSLTKDREQVFELIKTADIVIVNFKVGSAEKIGMDYPSLSRINNKLIYASITGFPDSDKPAFDAVLQAESGFMSMNGTLESGPLKMPVALIDILAAHQLKEAILIALLKREKSGKGSLVSTTLAESAVASLANQASAYLNTGIIPSLNGSLHPSIAPYGDSFFTSDGVLISFAVGTEEQFSSLWKILNFNSIEVPNELKLNFLRVQNRSFLEKKLSERISQFSIIVLEPLLLKEGIPFAKIKNLSEVFNENYAKNMILKDDFTNLKTISTISFKVDC